MDDEHGRLSIDELADLCGVSRRTVRYYVQEGLLPSPLGVGRGKHYDQTHRDRLLQVKAEQEAGRSLDDIRARPRRHPAPSLSAAAPIRAIPRSAWRRLELGPGVELHLAHDVKLPAASRLDELAEWCRRHLSRITEDKE